MVEATPVEALPEVAEPKSPKVEAPKAVTVKPVKFSREVEAKLKTAARKIQYVYEPLTQEQKRVVVKFNGMEETITRRCNRCLEIAEVVEKQDGEGTDPHYVAYLCIACRDKAAA